MRKSFLQSSHHYNLVIFPETFTLAAPVRTELMKKLDRPDTAALWIYAPGLNTPEKGFDDRNMLAATGIRLKQYPTGRRYPMEMMVGSVRFWHRNYNPGTAWSEGIRVYADDPQAKVIGKWMDDKRPSFVVKQLPNGGISIFSGTAITGTARWMMILDALGIPALASNETYVGANTHYLNIPLAEKQSTTITLPGKCFIRDVWSDQILAVRNDTVKLSADKPRTWLLETKEPLDFTAKLNPLPVIAAKLTGLLDFDKRGILTFDRKTDWQTIILFNPAPGVLGTTANNREMRGKRFHVDKSGTYRISGEFRISGVPGNKLGNFFFGFAPYTADNRLIHPETIRPINTGIWLLAKAVSPGDTCLILKNTDWKINTQYLCIAFDARKDFSDLPNFALSPRLKKTPAVKNADGTFTITLTAPMKFSRPAGTPVRLHSADANHIYAAGKNLGLTDQWQKLDGTVSGEAVRGAVSDRWWHGTRSAAPVFRYAGKTVPGGVIEFRNITVTRIK